MGETDVRGSLLQLQAVCRALGPGGALGTLWIPGRHLSAKVSEVHASMLGCENQWPGDMVQAEVPD